MLTVQIFAPGTYVTISGTLPEGYRAVENWAVLSSSVVSEETGGSLRSVKTTQKVTVLPVDDFGDDLGLEPITVNTSENKVYEI